MRDVSSRNQTSGRLADDTKLSGTTESGTAESRPADQRADAHRNRSSRRTRDRRAWRAAATVGAAVTAGTVLVTLTATPAAAAPTAQGQAAIRTVTSATLTDEEVSAADSPIKLLRAAVRCMEVGYGEQYCMHMGFMTPKVSVVQLDRMLVAAASGPEVDFGTATLLGSVRQYSELTYEQRKTRDRQEITDAAEQSIGSADLRQSIKPEPAPPVPPAATGAIQPYPGGNPPTSPSATAPPTAPSPTAPSPSATTAPPPTLPPTTAPPTTAPPTTAPPTTAPPAPPVPPRKAMKMGYGAQITNWYCGPAAVYSVASGFSKSADQGTWAHRLGTTQDGGTSVSQMPGVLNYFTERDRGGSYQSVSTGGTSADTFLKYVQKGVGTRNHPVIQQVKLWKQFFPYMRTNAGGHFQPVNGYDMTKRTVIYSEVYNEATFIPGGARTGGPKELPVNSVFGANKASYQAAPGVFGRLVL